MTMTINLLAVCTNQIRLSIAQLRVSFLLGIYVHPNDKTTLAIYSFNDEMTFKGCTVIAIE